VKLVFLVFTDKTFHKMQFLCISNLVFSRKLHTKRAYPPIFNRFLLLFILDFDFDHLLAMNACGTGKKNGLSKAHCEGQKQPNLDFSFQGLISIYNLHMKSLRLETWPPGSSKSPNFSNFEVNLKNISEI
jgi:hypothetical protein